MPHVKVSAIRNLRQEEESPFSGGGQPGDSSEIKNHTDQIMINRHSKGSHWLFVDGHVSRIGVRSLLRQKWHKRWKEDLVANTIVFETDMPEWTKGME